MTSTAAESKASMPDASSPSPRYVRRWQELAIEWLPGALGRLLDYGCGPCGLLEKLCQRATECHGVDVDAEKIEAAAARFPHFHLSTIDFSGRAPYPDGYFDTIASVEVVEHVPDERRTLGELARLLKPGGRLLVTTPHRGWLTFIDPGNFKFIFPRTHRFIHLHVRRNAAYYHQRFEKGAAKGLAGDISVGDRRPWHRHYRAEDIVASCPPELEVVGQGVYFPGMRALLAVRLALNVCSGGLITRLPWPLFPLEKRLSKVESLGGDQLVMLFRRRGKGD
jgi:SAM-dependent methyltransferase